MDILRSLLFLTLLLPLTAWAVDTDGDTVDDSIDNCPTIWNQFQQNNDGDSEGDACDVDDDKCRIHLLDDPTCLHAAGGIMALMDIVLTRRCSGPPRGKVTHCGLLPHRQGSP